MYYYFLNKYGLDKNEIDKYLLEVEIIKEKFYLVSDIRYPFIDKPSKEISRLIKKLTTSTDDKAKLNSAYELFKQICKENYQPRFKEYCKILLLQTSIRADREIQTSLKNLSDESLIDFAKLYLTNRYFRTIVATEKITAEERIDIIYNRIAELMIRNNNLDQDLIKFLETFSRENSIYKSIMDKDDFNRALIMAGKLLFDNDYIIDLLKLIFNNSKKIDLTYSINHMLRYKFNKIDYKIIERFINKVVDGIAQDSNKLSFMDLYGYTKEQLDKVKGAKERLHSNIFKYVNTNGNMLKEIANYYVEKSIKGHEVRLIPYLPLNRKDILVLLKNMDNKLYYESYLSKDVVEILSKAILEEDFIRKCSDHRTIKTYMRVLTTVLSNSL